MTLPTDREEASLLGISRLHHHGRLQVRDRRRARHMIRVNPNTRSCSIFGHLRRLIPI